MKSYKLTGLRRFDMLDVPQPEIERDSDVLVRMQRVGVCGSDIHYYTDGKIGSQLVQYPWAIGHEGAGTVVATGSRVTEFKPGDRVTFDPAKSCGECGQCRQGRPHTCEKLQFLGCPGQIEGCLSEYMVFDQRRCLHVPEGLSLDEAAFAEPLSIALYGASLYPSMKGASVGVLGCGPIGLCALQVALAHGAARVSVTDKLDSRLKAARTFGAHWAGLPSQFIDRLENAQLDVVFECCGQQDAMDQAVRILKPGGELSLIGIPEANRVSFDINLLRRKELRIQNVRRQNDAMGRALGMIESGSVNARAMITHRFPFAHTPEAFDLVANYADGVIKAMIYFD
ncbi:MAG: alcohol dehydrogenase catalytic domain-containing protein [Capsulimonadaceae bacterium]|nr:alcohol dehydrogenase catalytic domain-containing protein [Capsulimonadaceae bacterium]